MREPAPPSARHRSPNTVLWATFAFTSLAVGSFFLVQVHRRFGLDAALGLASLTARTAAYVSVGTLAEAALLRAGGGYLTETRGRRAVIHASAAALVIGCVALVVDLFVFLFAGYHLTTALAILFSDGPLGVARVVEAAGLPLSTVVGVAVGLAVALAGAVVISKVTRRLSSRRPIELTRRAALTGVAASLAAVVALDLVGARARDQFAWERELQRVPLAFAVVPPSAELASFAVSVRPPDPRPARARAAELSPLDARPDVFIVIVESLRRDIVTPEIMPRLAELSREGWTFSHAQTTGNVTHYSWYGLLCGEYPLFFDAAKRSPSEQGSVALAALRRLGYRTRLFATPDTAYQRLDSVVFGARGELLDEKFHPAEALAAERDRAVVQRVARAMETEPAGGKLHVVALDSTHFDYVWGADFRPPFAPYAADTSIGRDYARDATARAALFNRYKSSAAWMDQLLGQLFDALRRSGKLERSIVIVTGDHGEAFWEHGSGSHGSDLGREQLDVGFVLRLPGQAPRHDDAVISLMDVMPTVLAHLGVDPGPLLPGVPLQRRLREGDGALSPRAALTFQGWNRRAFRFALTHGQERLVFELDAPHPADARRLVLKDVTDLDSTSLVPSPRRDGPASAQRALADLPRLLDAMPFLRL